VRMIGATHDISKRVLLEEKLAKEKESKQREITSAVLTAQEKERADIGREMHDNLNQILGAAKLYIELAKTDDLQRDICLDKASGYIMDVIGNIRKISKTLITPVLEMGLVNSIKILVNEIAAVDPIIIKFTKNGFNEAMLNNKLQVDIFRIVQEQINNILKHAEATMASIHLTKEGNDLMLQIIDNGKGCDMKNPSMGLGLINIKARMDLHGGRTTASSYPGEGYHLNVTVPLS